MAWILTASANPASTEVRSAQAEPWSTPLELGPGELSWCEGSDCVVLEQSTVTWRLSVPEGEILERSAPGEADDGRRRRRREDALPSPDGAWVAERAHDGWAVRPAGELPSLALAYVEPESVALRGSLLAVGGGDGQLRLVNLDDLQVGRAAGPDGAALTALAWAEDGRLLAATKQGTLYVQEGAGWAVLVEGFGAQSGGASCISSPPRAVRVLDILPFDDGVALRLSDDRVGAWGWDGTPRFQANLTDLTGARLHKGELVAFERGSPIAAFDLDDGAPSAPPELDAPCRRSRGSGALRGCVDPSRPELIWRHQQLWLGERWILGRAEQGAEPRRSPDGRYVAARWRAGGVAVWDLHAQRVVQRLPDGERVFAWTPQGALVVSVNTGVAVWSPGEAAWTRHRLPATVTDIVPSADLVTVIMSSSAARLQGGVMGEVARLPESARRGAASPDGRRLATTGRDELVVVDLTDDEVLTRAAWPSGRAIWFDDDTVLRQVAEGGALLNVVSGQTRALAPAPSRPRAVARLDGALHGVDIAGAVYRWSSDGAAVEPLPWRWARLTGGYADVAGELRVADQRLWVFPDGTWMSLRDDGAVRQTGAISRAGAPLLSGTTPTGRCQSVAGRVGLVGWGLLLLAGALARRRNHS